MASLKKAIADKCKDCIYDPACPGTWREQVENCTSMKSCALWPVRPITVASTTANRKVKVVDDLDLDALVDGMDDEDEEELFPNGIPVTGIFVKAV